jgi:hypothetical protein
MGALVASAVGQEFFANPLSERMKQSHLHASIMNIG